MTDVVTELRYMFADIEGDKLVKYLNKPVIFDYGGTGDNWESFITPVRKDYPKFYVDWILLVPNTSILYGPATTFWDRVSQRPPVEYYMGHWQVWESGPLPAATPPKDPVSISVFLVPRSKYQQLNEERDKLTEIRMKNISDLRLEKSPSSGAHASTFMKDNLTAPLAIGRPKTDNLYPVPISLLQGEFAQFKLDIVSGPLNHDLAPLAYRWRTELSGYFSDETKREVKFHELLSELLDGLNVSKKKIGKFETDGGVDLKDVIELLVAPVLVEVKPELTLGISDALFEIVLYYLEGTRLILNEDAFKGDWRKTRLPSLLIIHNGPNVQALGAVSTTEPYVEPLSAGVPLYFNEFDTVSMENLIRFMTALRRLFRSLYAVYQNPNDHAVDADQVTFPYIRSYQSSSSTTISFKYTKRISQIRLVFAACTEDNRKIIVKFGHGHYGVDAHNAAALSNLAPALLGHADLVGGWWMVVMETLDDEWKPCDEFLNLEPSCKDAVREAVRQFHELGFVHGDLRDTNVFVRSENSHWGCQLIDYDWAGREGEVVYPVGVYSTSLVWRPELHMGGQLITSGHDSQTVEEFLKRRTKTSHF